MQYPRRTFVALSLLAAAGLWGCNDYPVHRLLDTFEVRVTSKLSNTAPVKLDFLWVIDQSPSMCQEQRDLTKGFGDFIANLQKVGGIDAQMAVVTVQQIADIDKTQAGAVKAVGQFMHEAAKTFPPNCIEQLRAPCGGGTDCAKACATDTSTAAACIQNCADAQCTQSFSYTYNTTPLSSMCPVSGTETYNTPPPAGADWRCYTVPPLYTQNDNCSYNSYCWKHCTTNQECRDLYEPTVSKDKQRMICYVPGGTTVEKAGCMFPPDTSDCPTADKLPAVLDQAHLNLFHCNAMVGASQTQESKFEGGFRSAWMALDPNGANCPHDASGKPTSACQYKQLVRDGAYLIIVFVSDDDECSVNLNVDLDISTAAKKAALYGDGVNKGYLPKDDMFKCQQLGDAIAGNSSLNEGYCEYRKSKDPAILCPSDCRGKTGVEYTTCMVPVNAMAVAKGFRRTDARFAPVSEFVNRFKSLKSDPSHVLVASITGDALPIAATSTTDEGKVAQILDQQHWDQVTYFRSLIHNVASGQSPYICAGGTRGTSGYGSRYIQLARAFGSNGVNASICSGSDFGPALSQIADLILMRTTKLCLSQPPAYSKEGAPQISLMRTRAGKKTPLSYGESADYIIKSSPDCCASQGDLPGESEPCKSTGDCAAGLRCVENLCKRYCEAVYFTGVQEKGDEIEMNYAADMGL